MEGSINPVLLQTMQFTAILLSGLVAGLFYGYDCSVNKGLGNLTDDIYLQSFQSINKVIQNPYFFMSFMGSFLVLPATTWLCYKASSPSSFFLMLMAALIYLIAVFGVTVLGNVPLNELLAKFPISSASEKELSGMRKTFETSWNSYHTIRTYASIIAFALTILSLIKNKI